MILISIIPCIYIVVRIFSFSFTIEGRNEMGELNVALVNSHRLFLISGRQPSEKRKKKKEKKKKKVCARGENERIKPFLSNVA
jgi:hypothetical protein